MRLCWRIISTAFFCTFCKPFFALYTYTYCIYPFLQVITFQRAVLIWEKSPTFTEYEDRLRRICFALDPWQTHWGIFRSLVFSMAATTSFSVSAPTFFAPLWKVVVFFSTSDLERLIQGRKIRDGNQRWNHFLFLLRARSSLASLGVS